MKIAAPISLALLAGVANAEIVTYKYTGVVSTQTFWTSFHGVPVELSVSIDTDTTVTSQSDNLANYQGAVVDGYFQIGEDRFGIDDDPRVNNVSVRTNVVDTNFGTVSNRYQVSFTSDGIACGGWEFPGTIMLMIRDSDSQPDTVLDTGLLQPLNTLRTSADGGTDTVVASMGAFRGVFSTITSGNGTITIVPAPGAGLVLSAGVLAWSRRR